jgi:hypothetical protein
MHSMKAHSSVSLVKTESKGIFTAFWGTLKIAS